MRVGDRGDLGHGVGGNVVRRGPAYTLDPTCLLAPGALAHMKPERIQLGLAVIGLPLLLVFWKQDAKWPNPFRMALKEKDKGA